jgi:hypothetical protein
MTATRIHLTIFAAWGLLALALGIKIALLGSEEAMLAKARGADLKARTDLAFQLDRMKSQLEVEASAPALETSLRHLGLPLQPPTKLAHAAW